MARRDGSEQPIHPGLREGRMAWARLYVEPVEHADGGIEVAVRRMTGE